jgi:MOSC domain-containing protein YiiM
VRRSLRYESLRRVNLTRVRIDRGEVVDIIIGPEELGPVRSVDEVEAVAGLGLKGDRYYKREKESKKVHDPSVEITLVELEGIKAAREESGLDITIEDLRRNIVTSGISLDPLVGHRFYVGDALVEALEENPPCRRLARIAGKPLLKPLIGKAGIRGRIVEGGVIKKGDAIRPA